MRTKYKYHYSPKFGWVNDPNGLVFYKGYYHLFYQHSPESEQCLDPMAWGHARTKDFLEWEELPVALRPETNYDEGGCWSGTAIEKDGKLYLFYASILKDRTQQISVAYSSDGIHFEKYEGNPILEKAPQEGVIDFRDPAIIKKGDCYYLIIASGHRENLQAFLLCYKSTDLFHWEYCGKSREWANRVFCECPSIVHHGNKYLLASSVCFEGMATHEFSVAVGEFNEDEFLIDVEGYPQCGPDQYAGQVFEDGKGRNILITWIPGWSYMDFAEKAGCFSLPMEILCKDGKIYTYPIEEVQFLLKDSDPAIERTEDGFIIRRTKRDNVVFKGEINDLKVLRDEKVLEIFINGGEKVVTAALD